MNSVSTRNGPHFRRYVCAHPHVQLLPSQAPPPIFILLIYHRILLGSTCTNTLFRRSQNHPLSFNLSRQRKAAKRDRILSPLQRRPKLVFVYFLLGRLSTFRIFFWSVAMSILGGLEGGGGTKSTWKRCEPLSRGKRIYFGK